MESHPFELAHRVDNSLSVWEEFKEITAKYNCISLGEGAPATSPPQFLIDDLMSSIKEGHNQYTRAFGNPLLAAKIAEVYGKKLGRKIDPMNEVNIGVGAYYVISDLLMTFIKPTEQEEVVLFEPSYPCYYDHIQYAGGIVKAAPLDLIESKWVLNPENFRKAFSNKTKVFIFNNAQNPTGKIFTQEELETITEILKEFPKVIVLSDEVYDFLTFDGKKFIPFASIGDNFKRTVTVYSGGKLFNATGWKCGWGIGPDYLIKPAGLLTYASIYCSHTPTQVAMSKSLDRIEEPGFKDGLSYVDYTCKEFQDVRDLFVNELKKINLPVETLSCESGYFIMVDISKCSDLIPERFKVSHDFEELKEGETGVSKNRYFMEDGRVPLDLAFCRWIAVTRGVVMMPCSLFYHKTSAIRVDKYARMAICKGMDTSVKAIKRLLQLV